MKGVEGLKDSEGVAVGDPDAVAGEVVSIAVIGHPTRCSGSDATSSAAHQTVPETRQTGRSLRELVDIGQYRSRRLWAAGAPTGDV